MHHISVNSQQHSWGIIAAFHINIALEAWRPLMQYWFKSSIYSTLNDNATIFLMSDYLDYTIKANTSLGTSLAHKWFTVILFETHSHNGNKTEINLLNHILFHFIPQKIRGKQKVTFNFENYLCRCIQIILPAFSISNLLVHVEFLRELQ